MSAPFRPAAELSAAFYDEVVRPLVGARPHSAALLGWGSDVLGYDTARSTDHGWGPRVHVLVERPEDVDGLRRHLDVRLPPTFRGWPVRFARNGGGVTHHVTVATLPAWLLEHLGCDATLGMSVLDWVLTPQQRLLGVVAGRVHADPSGALTAVRGALSWYPQQVWRWLVACQWQRIAEEEAFVNRTAEVGDETGSAVVAARLVRDLMRLALLLARRYAPYGKWLGTAFARLPDRDGLPGHLSAALRADRLDVREASLGSAYEAVARRHAATGLTAALDPATGPYHARPGRVLMAERFAEACRGTVVDPALRGLPLIGGVDQVVDSPQVLTEPSRWRRLEVLYRPTG